MATIKLKRSDVPGKVPLSEDLELGELAVNTADGELYLKTTDGEVRGVSGGTLAADLANPDKGAATVARGVVALDSIADLLALPAGQRKTDLLYIVKAYYTGGGAGGGSFYWDAASTETDNGGTVLGSGIGRFKRIRQDRYSPDDFGAREGVFVDNHTRIESMLNAGVPVNWGNKSYGLTESIGNGGTLAAKIDWISSGCRLYLDPNGGRKSAIMWYQVLPVDHCIDGRLIFDASFNAPQGLLLENRSALAYPLGYGTLYARHLTAKNIRRATKTDAGGDGIRVEGGFTSIVLDSPVVTDCRMAPGAGIATIVGISGISLVRDAAGGFPLYVRITNPHIENIESEDLNYTRDQDGIKLFGGLSADSIWSSFEIEGGQFINCFGRSIKSQMQSGKVTGTHFKRTRGLNAGGNDEISAQAGMVAVRDITFDYNGHVPSDVVSTRIGEMNRGTAAIDGIRGRVTGAVLPSVVTTYSSAPQAEVCPTNITVDGPVDCVVNFMTPSIDALLSVSNIEVNDLRSGLIRVLSGGINPAPSPSALVSASNVVNRGVAKPLVMHRVPGKAANAHVTTSGHIIGFTGSYRITNNAPEPAISTMVNKLTGAYKDGGFIAMESQVIPGGETVVFPALGEGGLALIDIKVRHQRHSHCRVSVDSAGMVEVYKGSNFIVGDTAEPARTTEIYGTWKHANGIAVKNYSTTSRNVTLLYFVS